MECTCCLHLCWLFLLSFGNFYKITLIIKEFCVEEKHVFAIFYSTIVLYQLASPEIYLFIVWSIEHWDTAEVFISNCYVTFFPGIHWSGFLKHVFSELSISLVLHCIKGNPIIQQFIKYACWALKIKIDKWMKFEFKTFAYTHSTYVLYTYILCFRALSQRNTQCISPDIVDIDQWNMMYFN